MINKARKSFFHLPKYSGVFFMIMRGVHKANVWEISFGIYLAINGFLFLIGQ